MYIDTHAHLTDAKFAGDLEAVVGRALDAGVEHIVTLGTDVETSRAAIALAERFPSVHAAVGIHPEAVRAARREDVATLRELAAHPQVVAIGEIGLDYYWDADAAELQKYYLQEQLALADDLGLPVSVHDRNAHADVLVALRARAGRGPRGVLHAFSGSEEMAREAIGLGFLISLGGPITFLNAREAPALVRALPLSCLVIETDSPYLAPHPLRGRRNEPANVTRVGARLAELKGLPVEQVALETSRNAQGLFGF